MNNKLIQEFIIHDKEVGQRLDLFLAESLKITRSKSQKVITGGLVLVSGKIEKPRYMLKLGDDITVTQKEPKKINTISIFYENDELIVIDKPSGVSVHPAPGEEDESVIEYLERKNTKRKCPEKYFVVHRLDKGTSGVMILAKSPESQNFLQKQFKDRTVEKEYIALVDGCLDQKAGKIELPLVRHEVHREKLTVGKNGREAITDFIVLKTYEHNTLVGVLPKTGRTHQIRVHFSAIGHPVVGDKKYGEAQDVSSRIFLHASKITFMLPITKELVSFSSVLPQELEDILKKLL